MLAGCSSFGVRSKPRTADRPAADLLATPATFAPIPRTSNPELTGAEVLPWALDTLSVGGDIRAKFVRLQNWVKALYSTK